MKKILLSLAFALSIFAGQASAQNIVPPDVVRYGASVATSAALTANIANVLILPASNTKGVIVHVVSWCSQNAGTYSLSVLAKATIPVSVIDGDVLTGSRYQAGSAGNCLWLDRSIFVPSGKGLYRISSFAESTVMFSVLYTILQ